MAVVTDIWKMDNRLQEIEEKAAIKIIYDELEMKQELSQAVIEAHIAYHNEVIKSINESLAELEINTEDVLRDYGLRWVQGDKEQETALKEIKSCLEEICADHYFEKGRWERSGNRGKYSMPYRVLIIEKLKEIEPVTIAGMINDRMDYSPVFTRNNGGFERNAATNYKKGFRGIDYSKVSPDPGWTTLEYSDKSEVIAWISFKSSIQEGKLAIRVLDTVPACRKKGVMTFLLTYFLDDCSSKYSDLEKVIFEYSGYAREDGKSFFENYNYRGHKIKTLWELGELGINLKEQPELLDCKKVFSRLSPARTFLNFPAFTSLDSLDIRETDTVIDIGCAAGQCSILAADLANRGRVIGVDLSKDNLIVARLLSALYASVTDREVLVQMRDKINRDRVKAEDVVADFWNRGVKPGQNYQRNLDLVQIHGPLIPFADNSIDKIINSRVTWYLGKEEKGQMLKEMLRVIRIGGKIYLGTLPGEFKKVKEELFKIATEMGIKIELSIPESERHLREVTKEMGIEPKETEPDYVIAGVIFDIKSKDINDGGKRLEYPDKIVRGAKKVRLTMPQIEAREVKLRKVKIEARKVRIINRILFGKKARKPKVNISGSKINAKGLMAKHYLLKLLAVLFKGLNGHQIEYGQIQLPEALSNISIDAGSKVQKIVQQSKVSKVQSSEVDSDI